MSRQISSRWGSCADSVSVIFACTISNKTGVCRHTHVLTPEKDTSKHSVVAVQCAAVPAMVSKLVLALSNPLLGALTDGLHDVWVPLAELPLLVH